jgi:hypothetical protein
MHSVKKPRFEKSNALIFIYRFLYVFSILKTFQKAYTVFEKERFYHFFYDKSQNRDFEIL